MSYLTDDLKNEVQALKASIEALVAKLHPISDLLDDGATAARLADEHKKASALVVDFDEVNEAIDDLESAKLSLVAMLNA